MKQLLDRIVQDWHGSGWLLALGRQYQMQPSPLIVRLHEQYQGNPPFKPAVAP